MMDSQGYQVGTVVVVAAAIGGLLFGGPVGCGRRDMTTVAISDNGVPVQLVAVNSTTFTQSVRVQGTLEARARALVPARIGGTIEAIMVEEGQSVTHGQALCLLDSEQLENAMETCRQSLAVAQSALDVSRAHAERTLADLEKATKDNERYHILLKDDAVSENATEQVETRWKEAVAIHKVSRAQVSLAGAQVRQVTVALSIAERNLRDATICAPIEGTLSEQRYELGEMVEMGNPVFRIDNLNALEFSAHMAEQYFPLIVVGKTTARLVVAGKDMGTSTVSYRSPTVNVASRTFEIQCVLDDPPAYAAPGMMADAEIVIDRREGRGVPTEALVTRGDKVLLFTVQGKQARALIVSPGYRTDGITEITNGLPESTMLVVGSGQFMLDDGDSVVIQEENSDVAL
jgi:RND family efflux transporter MFP subunit